MLAALAGLTLVLVASACGGSESASAGGDKKLTLVAYSTPREAYEEIIPAVPGDAGGRGRRLRAVLRAPPASRAGPSRPACRPTSSRFSLEPDITRLVDAGLVAADWNDRRVQGDGHRLGRRLRRPPGQPEEHPDLGRPAPATASRSSRPTRSPPAAPVEHHGRLRRPARAGQDARTRRSSTCASSSRHVAGAGQERARGAADLRRRQGRRPARLRERGDLRPAEGRAARVRRPRPDDPDREPGRRRPSTTHAGEAQAFVDFLRTPEAQRIFGEKGYRPVDRGRARASSTSRSRRVSSRSPTSAAGPR